MNNKKVLLGLTVLATPFVVENIVENNVANANATYKLTESVQVYGTAQNASKQVNSSRTYDQGTYYVYKQHNGMINISKTPGKAGAWINPTTGKTAEVATKKSTQEPAVRPTVETTKSVSQSKQQEDTSKNQTTQATKLSIVPPKEGQYSILKTTDAYVNALDASRKVNARGKVSAGNYYIFRKYKGMLNVSRAQGKVGSWINPETTPVGRVENSPRIERPVTTREKVNTPIERPEEKAEGQYRLTAAAQIYVSAKDASRQTNARGVYQAGNYYIFREYNGMLNISRSKGKVGSWINPGTASAERVENSSRIERPVTTREEVNAPVERPGVKTEGQYRLTAATQIYVSAKDASRQINARGVYQAGDYYIFREYNGMLNISRSKGKVGSWINPSGLATTTSLERPTRESGLTNSSSNKVNNNPVVYYNQDKGSWANKRYGGHTMRHTGCLPTSLAMAISTLSTKVTPVEIADYLYTKTTTFNKQAYGTTQDAIPIALGKYGLKYKLVNSKENLRKELANGALVMANVQGSTFITPGYTHAVVVKGMDTSGKVTVYNPYSTYGITKHKVDTLWSHQSKDPIDYRLGSPFIVVYK